MLTTFRLIAACFVALLALAAAPAHAAGAAPSTTACAPSLNHTFPRLQDEKPQTLCQYAGKVVLIVNTASYCGYTPQYKGLQALNEKYKPRGLVILGFPSNDFGQQEPGSEKEIADFCDRTYAVKFPMFGKTGVKDAGGSRVFDALAKATGERPKWNFHKYLVARDGSSVASFPSKVDPESPEFVAKVEEFLK
jgi:glutathione peroxidase